MGMFDEVLCRYSLPWPELFDERWQSKSTPSQRLDRYEIRADGTLWHEAYAEKLDDDPLSPFGLRYRKEDHHWAPVSDFCGELEIHTCKAYADRPGGKWYEVRFWFRDGQIKDMLAMKSEYGTSDSKGEPAEPVNGQPRGS